MNTLRWLAFAALCMVALFVLLQRLVDHLLFQPTSGVDVEPRELNIDAESIFLTGEDGVRIHAFFLPSPGAHRALLFLHGNAGNASHRLPNAALLAQLDTHVLLLDYRGYGLSGGSPSEQGLHSDAQAGLDHLVETRGIPARQVFVFGRSLGGAVATRLAVEQPLAGVILESTFSSVADIAARFVGPLAGPLAGERFDSLGRIRGVRAPLLFFHGDRDRTIPLSLGQRLYDAAPEPKAFEILEGADHNDTLQIGGRAYLSRIRRFLDENSTAIPKAAVGVTDAAEGSAR